MTTLSKFVHIIELDNGTFALWNSLWLRTIFIYGDKIRVVRCMQQGATPQLEQSFAQALTVNHFFSSEEDVAKLVQVREVLQAQPIELLYLIMTEGCNLACGYCFLRDMVCNQKALESSMSFEVACQAIDLFGNVLSSGSVGEPKIIFYGGEPLINWSVMFQALGYARERIPACTFTLNTNGLLITPKIAQKLKEYDVGVALSLDGRNNDVYRRDRGGNGSLERVLSNLWILQAQGCSIGISCTVTDANLDCLEGDFLWMVDDLGLHSVDFNILLGGSPSEDYARKAAQKILACYHLGRERGVYVDRVMRRVNSFAKGQLNLVDCGGCGQQLVCAPDGQIGCCHAFLNDRSFFYPQREVADPEEHPLWKEWKQRSPFNIPECLGCEALGICGGGCFYNAYLREGNIWGLDKVHCTLVKETLRVTLSDMWESLQK